MKIYHVHFSDPDHNDIPLANHACLATVQERNQAELIALAHYKGSKRPVCILEGSTCIGGYGWHDEECDE